ncbi:hypothetical protein K432DRAFT_343109 [Lepidopterella palustris CBS 459.81]|uniref:F-box domain-containing protein n=1 Tax=Lepidopterella palustris CBS 459.81 TaxID=1314670 RepID=A0A8E2EKK3_9PEZI|nr:hypothetical protein K432DRAFT_343109 [Lepidopterella palustris CBS 459.81]
MSSVTYPSSSLLKLAPELLENIFSFLNPHDVVNFGRTCHRANAFIRPTNQILWRNAFLHDFDDPQYAWAALLPTARAANKHKESQWDWYRELRRRLLMLRAIRDGAHDALHPPNEDFIETLMDIFETAVSAEDPDRKQARQGTSLNLKFLDDLFRTIPRAEHLIHDFHRDIESLSFPLEGIPGLNRPLTRSMVPFQRVSETASRFHVYYGRTEREKSSPRAKASARAFVYDFSVTGSDADHGPFKKDKSGLINWPVLEACSSLMIRNFEIARGGHIETPTGFKNSIPHLLPVSPLCPEDWAGVSGAWLGTYAFLDYRDLFHYNFAHHVGHGAGLETYEEACGDLMQLELKLCEDDELKNDPRFDTDLPVCDDLPMLYFRGMSSGHRSGRPRIGVRGAVSLVPGGQQVRWRFLISYAGADQWQLEGVQPGGVRSGGIFGLWTHCDHDENGPVGPFCYYPLCLCSKASFT